MFRSSSIRKVLFKKETAMITKRTKGIKLAITLLKKALLFLNIPHTAFYIVKTRRLAVKMPAVWFCRFFYSLF